MHHKFKTSSTHPAKKECMLKKKVQVSRAEGGQPGAFVRNKERGVRARDTQAGKGKKGGGGLRRPRLTTKKKEKEK